MQVTNSTETALSEALRAVGLDPSNAPPAGDLRATDAPTASELTRWAVVSGDTIRLVLSE